MIWEFFAARFASAVQGRNHGQRKQKQTAVPQDKPTRISRLNHFLKPRSVDLAAFDAREISANGKPAIENERVTL
jgi:hypothetical protein